MGKRHKYSLEDKMKAVLDYKNGVRGMTQIGIDLGMSHATASKGSQLLTWVKRYEKHGESAFYPKVKNQSYSKDFKMKIVQEYLNGKGSLCDLCIKHDIAAEATLLNWVNSYNSHEELKDYYPKGEVYMTKSRKTTLEERIEIVQYCLDNNKEYKLAAEKFNVSYAQVFQWIKKYLELGEEGLTDKRGKRKGKSQLSELEKLQRENERLKRQLELKERENIILKKLKEVERRRYSPKANKNQNT